MNVKNLLVAPIAGALIAGGAGVVLAAPAEAAAPSRVYTGQACQQFGSTGVWPWRTTWTLTGDSWSQCTYRKTENLGPISSVTSTVYLGKIKKNCGTAWYQQNC